MSVSKLCSTVTGLHAGAFNTKDEKYTYSYLKSVLKDLDEAVGYTANGGRTENNFPEEPAERLAAYERVGEIRRNPNYHTETALAKVSVKDENGKPLIAELRLIPADVFAEKGVSLGYTSDKKFKPATEIASIIYGRGYPVDSDSPYLWFDYFRRTTDEKGEFSEELPAGKYNLVVSKGSEYEIVETGLKVPGEANVTLCRMIDLSEDSWYVGDLHHHSFYSSPKFPPQGTDFVYDTPEMIQRSMRARGLTFGALSDHHNTLNHRIWEKLVTPDFLPILSKEISTSNGHVLQLNTDPDVIYHIPPENERTPEVMRKEFVRITDEIKSFGGHPQINHPRDMQKAISFPPEFTDMIDVFKTIEIWNGSHPLMPGCTNGNAMELWLDCLEKGVFLGATTGSDTHEISCEFWFDSIAYFFGMYLAVSAAVDNTKTLHSLNGVILTGDKLEEAEWFLGLMKEQLPALNNWCHRNLSSGCVRTYVQAKGERTPENILKNLEEGHSFLTNGPILIANMDGNEAKLKIVSNRPLKKLVVLSNGHSSEEFELAEPEPLNGGYDYSCTVSLPGDKKWFIFRVFGEDYTTQAITNPVFV